MKFIIFSDIHLSNYSGKVNPVEKISQRLVDQKSILQQLIDLAIQENATLLDGGDVFHCVGAVPTEALNVYSWFLKEVEKYELKYYATQGNHDLVLRKDGKQWHSILNLFQDKQQRDKELSEMKIRFVDYDEEDVYSIKDNDIVVLHKQPACSNKYGFKHEGIDWKKVAKNNRLCFYGHFHETKKLGTTSYVIGQPMQMTQADVGEDRGCWIIDSKDWSVTFHKLEYPELQKIEKLEAKEEKIEERIKATSFNDILLEWLVHENKDNSYLELIKNDLQDKIQVNKNVFKGKIQKVYVKDFLSFEEITIEFKNGFWLVLGVNGAGKTTLFESLLWILFDDTTKQLSKNEVIRNRPTKQKDAYGELTLVDDKTYIIQRSVKNGLEVICDKKNLVEGMAKIQAQEFLEKNVLGFDKNTYLASCYFSQEGLLTLAQLGDADTTNLVTNLLGFETYNTLHELMSTRIKEVTLQLEQLEKSSVNLNNDIWKNSEQQKNLKEQIEQQEKLSVSLKKDYMDVTIQIGEFTTLLGNIIVPSVTTEDIDVSLFDLNDAKTEMVIKQWKLQEDGQLRTQDLRKQLNLLQTKLNTILQEQNKIDKEKSHRLVKNSVINERIKVHTENLNSLKENTCFYCKTILNNEDIKNHINEEMVEITSLKNQLSNDSSDLDKQLEFLYDQEAQNQELTEQINKQISESDAEITEIITANNAEISKIDKQIDELHYKKLDIVKEQTEANSRKSSLTAQIKQLEHRAGSLMVQLSQLNVDDKIAQLKKLENDFDNLDAEKLCINDKKVRLIEHLDIYNFWLVAFSNKGIRPLLLDKFVNEFNSLVKKYCYQVSAGEFIVEFTPTSKIRSGLERNKLGLQVVYKDKLVNYAALSGGEKTRCNLPLCLGLNKWISQKHGLSNGIFGMMIFDELFCFTDTKFRENVAQVLFDEGKTKSIFVIDHSDTLMAYTSDLWLISKQNDVTQLQVV